MLLDEKDVKILNPRERELIVDMLDHRIRIRDVERMVVILQRAAIAPHLLEPSVRGGFILEVDEQHARRRRDQRPVELVTTDVDDPRRRDRAEHLLEPAHPARPEIDLKRLVQPMHGHSA